MGQPGTAGLGALPTSAPSPPPSWVPAEDLEDPGWSRGSQKPQGSWGGEEVGRGLSRSRRLIYFTPLPLPHLVLQTVSVNKAINTQEVAVKEKHARNILLDAILGRPTLEGGQIVGPGVRRRLLAWPQEE